MSAAQDAFREQAEQLGLPVHAQDECDDVYIPLAAWVSARRDAVQRPYFLAVSGAQGAGKSTFCSLLSTVLECSHGLRTAILSLDDVYLSRAERTTLATTVHPLCKVRGVPGTHDLALAHSVVQHLMEAVVQDLVL